MPGGCLRLLEVGVAAMYVAVLHGKCIRCMARNLQSAATVSGISLYDSPLLQGTCCRQQLCRLGEAKCGLTCYS
jgi:hypothetical protein